MRRSSVPSFAAILLLAASAAAAEEGPKSLACSFETGTSASYDGGVFKSQTAGAVRFEIDDIDLKGLSATIATGGGGPRGKIAIARAIGANHYLEIAPEGFWNITTIYDTDAATGRHPAVHSRHSGVLGQAQVAQYTGNCTEK